MNPLTVVDYSIAYYCHLLKQDQVPPQRGGKFVLITHQDDAYLVFSPLALSRQHADIVQRFLSLRQVHVRYDTEDDVSHPSSPEWKVVGGGHWELDETPGTLRLFGRSQAYGGVDLAALAARLHDVGGLAGSRSVTVG